MVVTQVPAGRESGPAPPDVGGILRAGFYDGARIVLVENGAVARLLTEKFHSAADPDLSFDGTRMLFAGKRSADDDWNVFEMALDGKEPRQITRDFGDCRGPVYLGAFYTIVSPEPWDQIAFVGNQAGELDEHGATPSTSLYTSRMDGSGIRRLTYNPSSDLDPTVLPDGRLLFASWQRMSLARGPLGRLSLFTAQTDGLDYALFSGDEGDRFKLMPAVTTGRLVVFVEGDKFSPDGAGRLAAVSLRRNLHSHAPITSGEDGFFHSPAPLPDGKILVSRRPAIGEGTHAVGEMDTQTGRFEPLFDDPDRHDVQARAVLPRPRPDGRSSGVKPENPGGKLYGLNIYDSDLTGRGWVEAGTPLRLRVLEGVPWRTGDVPTPLGPRRFLGEIPVEEDGSFNIQVPANIPVELQLVDADGMALRSGGWIWVQNNETRGCIGCHEDGERTPENRFVKALKRESMDLTLPPAQRRTVNFRRDVMPILNARCATDRCHGEGGAPPLLGGGDAGAASLDGEEAARRAYASLMDPASPRPGRTAPAEGKYVHPGRARTSPLVWHLYGWATHRPWDRCSVMGGIRVMSPPGAGEVTDEEKRTLVEWIDLGAQWSAGPHRTRAPTPGSDGRGGKP
jgi:hypothetical protein